MATFPNELFLKYERFNANRFTLLLNATGQRWKVMRSPRNSHHKGPVMREMLPFHDDTMGFDIFIWRNHVLGFHVPLGSHKSIGTYEKSTIPMQCFAPGALRKSRFHIADPLWTNGRCGMKSVSMAWRFRVFKPFTLFRLWRGRQPIGEPAPFWHGLTLIPLCKSNCIHYELWDEITYPFPNFNGCTVEVWEWISNFIPHFIGHVVTYPCWDLS